MAGRRELRTLYRRLQGGWWPSSRLPIQAVLALPQAINPADKFLRSSLHKENTSLKWKHTNPVLSDHFDEPEGASAADDTDDIQQRVLSAALQHVKVLGWSTAAMETAAVQLGLSPAVVGSFPRREGHLVEAFNEDCNRRLKEELAKRAEELKRMRVRERVELGIKLRLEMITSLLESWPNALAVQARPSEVSHSFRNYSDIADIIWRAAGDKSTDFNWYTKRGSVVCIYIATEIHLLTDTSGDFIASWKFLQRRIDDVMAIGKHSNNTLAVGSTILEALSGGLLRVKRQKPGPRDPSGV